MAAQKKQNKRESMYILNKNLKDKSSKLIFNYFKPVLKSKKFSNLGWFKIWKQNLGAHVSD